MKKWMNLSFVVGLILFIILAWQAYITPYFPLDLIFSKWVQSLKIGPIVPIFNYLDLLGFYPKVQIWIGTLILILFLLKKRLESIFFLFIALVDSILFFSLSSLIHRPRPSPDLIHVTWQIKAGSFPSGHVLMYTLLFGFMIYIIKNQMRPGIAKLFLTLLCLLIILSTGFARIFSGQHWPSDILGGYLLASITLYLIVRLYERVKKSKFKGLERFF